MGSKRDPDSLLSKIDRKQASKRDELNACIYKMPCVAENSGSHEHRAASHGGLFSKTKGIAEGSCKKG
ncbi:MAG: hypothetical protein PVG99_09480, partial [Desulfobacteraceae bacterium]